MLHHIKMSYVLAHRSNRPADFFVVFSRLQAGGFHPITPNLEHGTLVAGYIMALGGFDILLPEHEIAAAKLWMHNIDAIEDHDPIPDRKTRDLIQASILNMNPIFFLYTWPPLLLAVIVSIFIILISGFDLHLLIYITLYCSPALCLIGILYHARHIYKSTETKDDLTYSL